MNILNRILKLFNFAGRSGVMPLWDRRPAEWKDTDGNFIQAHGAGVLYYKKHYYLYGQNLDGPTKPGGCGARVDVKGVSCYTSPDLVHWTNCGIVLPAVLDDVSHDLHSSKILERPKVVYNAKTKKFVMWAHIDSADYTSARVGVAVSDSPTGPFEFLRSINPNGQESRDMTVFQDDDGKAYLIHSSDGNKTTIISELRDDYLTPSGRFVRVFVGRFMEAPALFKRAGKYYFMASGCTGWHANEARSAVADSIWGPWTELGNPARGDGSDITFNAQSTFVLPVAGGKDGYLFMADRWRIVDLGRSGYLWLPIIFEDGRPFVENPRNL